MAASAARDAPAAPAQSNFNSNTNTDAGDETVLDLRHVAKTYRGRIRALDGIQLSVRRGEIFGLLGPNGAGKSTLVKILMTVVKPTRINGAMLGRKIGDKQTLKRIGYLPEQHKFPSYLTGAQMLDYYAALADVPRPARRKRINELLETVGMKEWGNKRVSKYSKGMRQRLGLAQALMNEPEIVFLDEPTDGVDPVGRREIRNILKQLRDEGKTVFLNSHLLGEVEMVCDRVSILMRGRVVREGLIEDLTRESRRYEIEHSGRAPGWMNQLAGARAEERPDSRAVLVLPGRSADEVQPVIDRLRREERTIHRMEEKRDSLEDLFIEAVNQGDQTGGNVGVARAAKPGGGRAS